MKANKETLRYLGTCICGGKWKVRGKKLVHHGYTRPGIGYIEGDCFGVGYQPLELSPTLAEAWLFTCESNLAAAKILLPPISFIIKKWQGDRYIDVKVTSSDSAFKSELDSWKYSLSMQIIYLEREIIKAKQIITSWKVQALTSSLEVSAQKKEASDLRRAGIAQKKVEYVERLKKRIDKAVVKNDILALVDLYETILNRYDKLGVCTAVDGFSLVNRNDVFAQTLGVPFFSPEKEESIKDRLCNLWLAS